MIRYGPDERGVECVWKFNPVNCTHTAAQQKRGRTKMHPSSFIFSPFVFRTAAFFQPDAVLGFLHAPDAAKQADQIQSA